jgi:hypothetical protein
MRSPHILYKRTAVAACFVLVALSCPGQADDYGIAPMSIAAMAQQSQLPPCSQSGLTLKNWDNCQGSRQYAKGLFVGEFHSGQPNGQGTFTYADFDKYVGEERYVGALKYVGEFKDGNPNGQGTLTLTNGETFVGEFKDGKLKITLPNEGVEYFLEFKDGKLKVTLPDGGEYVQEYKGAAKLNGQLTSRGQLTWPNGGKYVGEFKDGKLNGQGTFTWPNGEKYVGEFKDGNRNGQGTDTWPNGEKYVGEFKDGTRNGQGTGTWPNGEKYVGEFKDGNPNGQGTVTLTNGEKYVGEFKDGKRNGQGTLYAADGSTSFSGMWADEEFVGAVASQDSVAMEKEGGVYVVPVRFNGAITLNAIIDSGAADVSIPADIVSTLIRAKTISEQDFLGVQTYVLADGTEVPSPRFRIRSLNVGNKSLENVTASIASGNAEILLGQSFLGRFKSWSVDNDRHVLILR